MSDKKSDNAPERIPTFEELLKKKISRRNAITSGAKAAIGVAAVVVVGAGAYAANQASTPPKVTTVTQTQTATQTQSVTQTATQTQSVTQTQTVTPTQTSITTTSLAPEPVIGHVGPYVDSLLFRSIANDVTAIAALENGEVDTITNNLPITTLTAIKAVPNLAIVDGGRTNVLMVFNVKGAVSNGATATSVPGNAKALVDVKFRQAFQYLVGDKAWMKDIFGEKAPTDFGILGEHFGEWYKKPEVFPQDFVKANALLDEAGYKVGADGWRTTAEGDAIGLEFLVESTPEVILIAQTMIAFAKKVNVKMTLRVQDIGSIIGSVIALKYDSILISGEIAIPDPVFQTLRFNSSESKPINFSPVDTEYDSWLFKEVWTLDGEQAKQAVWKVNELTYSLANPIQLGFIKQKSTYRTDKFVGWVSPPGVSLWGNAWNWLNVRQKNGEFGGEVRTAIDFGVSTANFLAQQYVARNLRIWWNVREALVQLHGLTQYYAVTPLLAESWSVQPDGAGQLVTFELARNVKWHDGQPFTSADVKFTHEIAQQFGRGSFVIPELYKDNLTQVETLGDNAVRFSLKKQSLWSLDWIGQTQILPKHIYENVKDPANFDDDKVVGTGPFKLKQWTRGEFILLERNKDYYRPPAVYDGNRWAPS